MDLTFLTNEAMHILEQNLDVVPLTLNPNIDLMEKIFNVNIELKTNMLNKSMDELTNELILPACSQLAMEINNKYPIDGCLFTLLELGEKVNGSVIAYKGVSIRIIKSYDMKKKCDILSLSVGVLKNVPPIKDPNTMLNPITLIITKDEITFYKKKETLTIENIISYKNGLGDRVKTFNRREVKKIAKFLLDSILQE